MASLLPSGKQQYFSNAGLPLVSGKLFTYQAGTTNPKTTYADAAATTANTNPVILDGRGEAVVFWSGSYRVQLQDALGNIIWTVDNVSEPLAGIKTSSTGSMIIPAGSTAQRDAAPLSGYFRYNVNLSSFEGYYASSWISIPKSVNAIGIPDGGNILLKTIGGQSPVGSGDLPFKTVGGVSIIGSGDVTFKSINGASLIGNTDIQLQVPLVSGVNIKTLGGVSILGAGDIPAVNSAAANLYLYTNAGGL